MMEPSDEVRLYQPAIPVQRPRAQNLRGDILFAFSLAIGLYLAWLLREVLVLLYVSALIAVVLMPVVRGVRRLRIHNWQPSHGVAIILIMAGTLSGVAVFLLLTLPPVVHEVTNFVHRLPGRSPALIQKVEHLPLIRHFDLPALEAKIKQSISAHVGGFVTSVGDWAGKLFDILTGIILTIYFLAEGDSVYRWSLSLVPVDRRQRLDQTLQRAAARMGRWLLGQFMLMLILGVCSGIVFGLMKVRYAFALAVLMGAFNIVPVVGALVSTSIAMLIALSDSWEKALGVMIFEIIYLQIENGFLVPSIMKTRVDLAGTAVFVALLFGASLAGVVGALVAVPSAVLVAVLLEEYFVQPGSAPVPDSSGTGLV